MMTKGKAATRRKDALQQPHIIKRQRGGVARAFVTSETGTGTGIRIRIRILLHISLIPYKGPGPDDFVSPAEKTDLPCLQACLRKEWHKGQHPDKRRMGTHLALCLLRVYHREKWNYGTGKWINRRKDSCPRSDCSFRVLR